MNSIQLTQLVKKEMWNTAQIIFWGIIFLLFFLIWGVCVFVLV